MPGAQLLVTGDLNFMNVTDAATPFARIAGRLAQADAVFSNMECCLYSGSADTHLSEGFYADPKVAGEALKTGRITAVGIANNVNYGNAAIESSIRHLDAIGVGHAGAGSDLKAATAPALFERGGVRYGVLQRSSVYWPTSHEAGPATPGIAVIRGHTAYQVPEHRARPGIPPMNRPGIPPTIITWANDKYLNAFTDDIAALRPKVDVLVASCHWGVGKEVLDYMTQIAHAAIEAGADAVIGHGPHYSLPVEVYRGRPIFYGLGSFSFHTGHQGKHGDWIGLLGCFDIDAKRPAGSIAATSFQFVRHDDDNHTYLCDPAREAADLKELTERSAALGAKLTLEGDRIAVSAIEPS